MSVQSNRSILGLHLNWILFENTYIIKEHVRKSVPVRMEKISEMNRLKERIQGTTIDLSYSKEAVAQISQADTTFNVRSLLFARSFERPVQLHFRRLNLTFLVFKIENSASNHRLALHRYCDEKST